jgi:hypothetical protein
MAYKKRKRQEPELYTYDKYECWWEDHSSDCEWKDIKEAEKDKPEICFTEGYLLKKDKDCHIFVMSFSHNQIGDEMIVANKNILELKKVGTKTFYVKDFQYGTYKN